MRAVTRIAGLTVVLASVGCADEPGSLRVTVRTNLAPGTDFDRVVVTHAGGMSTAREANRGTDFDRGVEAASFAPLAHGIHRVTAELLLAGTLIGRRQAVVRVSGPTSIVMFVANGLGLGGEFDSGAPVDANDAAGARDAALGDAPGVDALRDGVSLEDAPSGPADSPPEVVDGSPPDAGPPLEVDAGPPPMPTILEACTDTPAVPIARTTRGIPIDLAMFMDSGPFPCSTLDFMGPDAYVGLVTEPGQRWSIRLSPGEGATFPFLVVAPACSAMTCLGSSSSFDLYCPSRPPHVLVRATEAGVARIGIFGTGVGATLDVVLAACGNRSPEDGEQCDDGNRVSGDGCSATCAREHREGASMEAEPNDTRENAGTILLASGEAATISGELMMCSDVDAFTIDLPAEAPLNIAIRCGAPTTGLLGHVLGPTGALAGGYFACGTPAAYVAAAPGPHTINVAGLFGGTGTYTLDVTR